MIIKKTSGTFFVFKFNEQFGNAERLAMQELKDKIPASHRKWFPDRLEWRIHEDAFDEFWKILGGYVKVKSFNNFDFF